jgi:hypothetical protein
MRFRLGINNSGDQQFQDGVSNGMRNLFALPMLKAQAEEEAQTVASRQRLMDAQMAEHQAKADGERDQQARGGLGELLKSAALTRGVPLNQLDDATNYLQTGQLPAQYNAPGDGVGPTMPKPQYADPEMGRKIMETLGLTRQALTVGDKSVENIAKAGGLYQDQGITQQAVDAAGRGDDMTMSRLNAVRGKKEFTPFAAVGNTGVALNQVTGQGSTADAGLRALYGNVQGSDITKNNAAAAASNATAAERAAQTRKVNQEIDQTGRTGDIQLVPGQDGALVAVNKRTLQVQPLVGADGRPVVRGAPGGGGKPLTDSQAKANLFGARMMESGNVLDNLADDGVRRPGNIKTVSEGIAGAVPIVGDAMARGAGALTNWTQSDQQQQVEQAQRDFINAVLRRESGAAIAPSEFANANQQYFPQPGDKPKTLEQKRRNRQIATNLMLQEVPEAQRYRLGSVAAPTAPTAPPASSGGATGSFDAPAGRTVKVDY